MELGEVGLLVLPGLRRVVPQVQGYSTVTTARIQG